MQNSTDTPEQTYEGTALVVRDETPAPASLSLFGSDDPSVALERAVAVANVLKGLIVAQGYAKSLGRSRPGEKPREFVEVAGWQALGGFLDTFAQVEWSKPIERGFESRVVLIRRGQVVGAGEAICTRDEKNWSSRDDFALKSMSQTRAAGKAFRLTFGWLMTIAGYESTPQEEMIGIEPRQAASAPQVEQRVAAKETAQEQSLAKKVDEEEAKRDRVRSAIMASCKDHGITDELRHQITEALFGWSSTSRLTLPKLRELRGLLKAFVEAKVNVNDEDEVRTWIAWQIDLRNEVAL